MLRAIATTVLLLSAAPALSAEIACTPEILYRPNDNPFMTQKATGPWKSMAQITRVDLETGAYTRRPQHDPELVITTGTLTIIKKGSAEKYEEFIGIDEATGYYFRVAAFAPSMQFTGIEPGGNVQVGRCVAGDAGG